MQVPGPAGCVSVGWRGLLHCSKARVVDRVAEQAFVVGLCTDRVRSAEGSRALIGRSRK